jgi:hypothetical protein
MKTAMGYLDDLKDKLGSDYKIAKAFGVDTAAVSMIRKRGKVSDEVAIKIADLLGVPREEVLIAAAIARSEGEVKDSWVKLYKNVSRAAVVILAVSLLGYKSDAYESTQVIESFDNNIHYAKLRRFVKRAWWAILSLFVRKNKNEKAFKFLPCPS